MKLKNILYSMMMGTAVLTGTTSCVSDLDQYPHTETTSKDVYTSLANYEAVLGKIYAAMVTSGQGKGGDNKDMASVLNNGSGFDYMRMFINMQECGTDEFASTWLTGEQTTGLELISPGMPTMLGYQICIIASTTTSPSAMSSCAMPTVPVSQVLMQRS